MTKFNLNNNGKPIGKGNINKENVKLFKKGLTMTFLAFGTSLALASCKPKEEIKVFPSITVAPAESVLPAIYDFDQGNGTIIFTTKENVSEFGYVLEDNFDKEVEWCEEKFQELKRQSEQINAIVDPGFNDLENEQQLFRTQYEEYIEQGPSIERDAIIREKLDKYRTSLEKWVGEEYKPALVDKVEIERINYLEEGKSFEGPYYKIKGFRVEKDKTLSEILSYADNREQYEKIYNQAIIDNNIEDPDKIYENDTLDLTGLDEEDLENMGYRKPNEAEMVDTYLAYFKMIKEEGMPTITGDEQGLEVREEIINDIDEFKKLVRDPDVGKDVISYANELCKKINVYFGYDMPVFTAHKR